MNVSFHLKSSQNNQARIQSWNTIKALLFHTVGPSGRFFPLCLYSLTSLSNTRTNAGSKSNLLSRCSGCASLLLEYFTLIIELKKRSLFSNWIFKYKFSSCPVSRRWRFYCCCACRESHLIQKYSDPETISSLSQLACTSNEKLKSQRCILWIVRKTI